MSKNNFFQKTIDNTSFLLYLNNVLCKKTEMTKIGEESVCKSCEQFEACHKINGVCWKQVIIAYGYDKWDYPDPRCPKAPKPVRRFWLE